MMLNAIIDSAKVVAVCCGAITPLATGYVYLDGPLPASKHYVLAQYDALKNRAYERAKVIPFHPGDRIKMTDRYAAVLMLSTKLKGCNWYTRRGVVERANRDSVFIKWNDRASIDQHPNGAVELDVMVGVGGLV